MANRMSWLLQTLVAVSACSPAPTVPDQYAQLTKLLAPPAPKVAAVLQITAIDPELRTPAAKPSISYRVPVVTVVETANLSGAIIDDMTLMMRTDHQEFIGGGPACLSPGNQIPAGSVRRIEVVLACFEGSSVSPPPGIKSVISVRYHDDAGVEGTASASLFMDPLPQ